MSHSSASDLRRCCPNFFVAFSDPIKRSILVYLRIIVWTRKAVFFVFKLKANGHSVHFFLSPFYFDVKRVGVRSASLLSAFSTALGGLPSYTLLCFSLLTVFIIAQRFKFVNTFFNYFSNKCFLFFSLF